MENRTEIEKLLDKAQSEVVKGAAMINEALRTLSELDQTIERIRDVRHDANTLEL